MAAAWPDPAAGTVAVVAGGGKRPSATTRSRLRLFRQSWNRCPAHSIVPALLADIWESAKTDTGGHA
jgi:hypothetical protein